MNSLKLLIISILLYFIDHVDSDESPVRRTVFGSIQGLRKRVLDKDVDVFLGIPYAEPPVGESRFKRPQKIRAWTGTRTTTTLPPACMQKIDTEFDRFEGVEMWNPNTKMSEDCLYLNVWEPRGGSPNKAIMVWIYGGGFTTGSSALDLYEGSVLAAEGDVIVMSMQYRVGTLGFLFLRGGDGSKDPAPGNMGLIDQALAIQWIRDNAGVFGGNPSKITLFGESAGAGSVSHHLLSPLTKDIIQSSIMQSGSALAHWAFDSNERAHAGGMELAAWIGCSGGNITRGLSAEERRIVMRCLQLVNPRDLVKYQFHLETEKEALYTPVAPTIDGYFLTEIPTEAAIRDAVNRKSILLGVNKDEGFFFLAYYLKELILLTKDPPKLSKSQYEDAVRSVFHFVKKFVADTVAFEYSSSHDEFDEKVNYGKTLDDILGDHSFKCPVLEFARIYAKTGKRVYLYQFNHRTSYNDWPGWMGAMHGYEIDQVFGRPFDNHQRYKTEESDFSRKLMRYWTNFAKTGDPNRADDSRENVDVVWPSYDLEQQKILMLNTTNFYVHSVTTEWNRRCQYWKEVYPQLKLASDLAHCSAAALERMGIFMMNLVVIGLLRFVHRLV